MPPVVTKKIIVPAQINISNCKTSIAGCFVNAAFMLLLEIKMKISIGTKPD